MNKVLAISILAIVILPMAFAELKYMERNVTVRVQGKELRINATGLDYSKSMTISNNSIEKFDKQLKISWYQNISCDTDLKLNETKTKLAKIEFAITNLTNCLNKATGEMNYYQLYLDCYANRTSLLNYKQSNDEYKLKYETCNLDNQGNQNMVLVLQNRVNNLNASCTVAYNDLSNKSGLLTITTIAAILCGAFAANLYFKFKRPYDKRGTNPESTDARGLNPK